MSATVLHRRFTGPACLLALTAAAGVPALAGPWSPELSILTLGPRYDEHVVGLAHVATARLRTQAGEPIVGQVIHFEVTAGPSAGATGDAATGPEGTATFQYVGAVSGTDTLVARTVLGSVPMESLPARVLWYDAFDGDMIIFDMDVDTSQAYVVDPQGIPRYLGTGAETVPFEVYVEIRDVEGDGPDAQGISKFVFDLVTNTGLRQDLPNFSFTYADQRARLYDAVWVNPPYPPWLYLRGGFGFNGITDRGNATSQPGNVLGIGVSIPLTWDADIDNNALNGLQPNTLHNVGYGTPPGTDVGGHPVGDREKWYVVEAEVKVPDAPGTYHVDIGPGSEGDVLAAGFIAPTADLNFDITGAGLVLGGRSVHGSSFQFVVGSPLDISLTDEAPFFVRPQRVVYLGVRVQPNPFAVDPQSGLLHFSVNNAAFQTRPIVHLGGELYSARLPTSNCGDAIEYYLSFRTLEGLEARLPTNAPNSVFRTTVALREERFSEDFELGLPTEGWTFQSDPGGRILALLFYQPCEGSRHMTMDSSGVFASNVADWRPGLAGAAGALLTFQQKEFSDEDHPLPPIYFVPTPGDGVCVSDTGVRWVRVVDLTGSNSGADCRAFEVDLGRVADEYAMTFWEGFAIRFQQYDNASIPSDGFAFDDIRLRVATCVPDIADLDADGDVDLSDFLLFRRCFGGSNNPPAPTCQPGVNADLDGDGDVDLADFAIFQAHYTGSF